MRQLNILLLAYLVFHSVGAMATPASDARGKALAWMIQKQQGDGSWVDRAGQQSTATALVLDGLAGSGINYGYVSGAAASWLTNQQFSSVEAQARQIVALAHMGANTAPSVSPLLAARTIGLSGPSGAPLWGPYSGWSWTATDTALAYEALLAAANANAANMQSALMSLQRSDGGWAPGNLAGEHSAVIPTAQALRALAQFSLSYPSQASTANSSVTNAVTWLLARTKSDGGYADDADAAGATSASKPGQVFETALVWGAINLAARANYAAAKTTAATSALGSAQTFLLNKQGSDGSWGGDAFQTASVLAAWGTTGDASATLADTDHDGVPDLAEAYLGTSSTVADARGLPKGNGNSVAPKPASASDDTDVPIPPWAIVVQAILLLGLATWRSSRLRA